MGLGPMEIVVICVLGLVLFGGAKFADVGKGLGEGIKNFKRGLRESHEEDQAHDEKKLSPKDPNA